MKLEDFNYSLPMDLIAQRPLKQRDKSRLMEVSGDEIGHRKFEDIADCFSNGDILVVNDTKVSPAKLIGKKESGGIVKILLTKQKSDLIWECLAQGKKPANKKIFFNMRVSSLRGDLPTSREKFFGIIKNAEENHIAAFSKDIAKYLDKIGKAPLPAYIKYDAPIKRYNTVYATKPGSIAAPTAGLHFTPRIIKKIKDKRVLIAPITLHVGLGTFLPVKTENIESHAMHFEYFSISKETADIINERKGKLFVVGTTSIRALESAADINGELKPTTKETNLFIYPGYKWKLKYDGLITNFHMPKSTLLMLVMAFLSRNRVFEAYNEAIKNQYRFYSFGDAMIILR